MAIGTWTITLKREKSLYDISATQTKNKCNTKIVYGWINNAILHRTKKCIRTFKWLREHDFKMQILVAKMLFILSHEFLYAVNLHVLYLDAFRCWYGHVLTIKVYLEKILLVYFIGYSSPGEINIKTSDFCFS